MTSKQTEKVTNLQTSTRTDAAAIVTMLHYYNLQYAGICDTCKESQRQLRKLSVLAADSSEFLPAILSEQCRNSASSSLWSTATEISPYKHTRHNV